MSVSIQTDRRINHEANKKLAKDNPETHMICPRCNGTKYIIEFYVLGGPPDHFVSCTYCKGSGLITWVDNIMKGRGD
jgi:hypothetical protein